MFLFLGAMNGAVFSNNLMWFLVFWEITTICSYLLIRHEGTAEAKRSGLRALVYTFGGGVALVAGIILLQHYSGTILLSEIPGGGALAGLALLPVAMMAIAAFTKSAQVPFQNWLLGAMVAPTPVSALLHSSTMVNLGVYLLLRLSPSISHDPGLSWGVALVGGISFLATSILAMAQSSSKRVLAYSTIGNLGLIVLCAAIGTKEALFAALVLLLFHAISKALLFMSVGVVKHETGDEDIEPMDGLRDRMPFVAFALLIGVLTVLIAPFGVFASKWMISEIVANYPLLAFVLAIGFGASVVFYGKWIGRAFMTEMSMEESSAQSKKTSKTFKWTLGALMIGAVGLSVLSSQVVSYLIIPYLGPLPNDPFFVIVSFGPFPLLVLLIAPVLVLIALALRPKSSKIRTTDAYTGGEPFEFHNAGAYFYGGSQERKAVTAFNLLAVMLLVALVLIPLLQEVGVWTH
jgi:ech hydrogenase subunit A